MKKKRNGRSGKLPGLRKIVLIMKITVFFLFVSFLSVSAATYSQNIKLTLEKRNASIVDVLTEISERSDMQLLYNDREVKGIFVDISLKDATVTEILDKIFNGIALKYSILDGVIVVSPRKQIGFQQDVVKSHKLVGTVKDKDGSPLPGATVRVKDTQVGVITDNDGVFKMDIPDLKDLTLVISFVGYRTVTIKPEKKNELSVILEEDTQSMDEVVVTGYFNKNKNSYTGSAVTVQAEELKKISPINIFQALAAYEPSLEIVENNEYGSDPNKVPEILIRGKSSFEGKSNNPLFIMDGYEVDLQMVFDLDMERIKSVTILKDASATAIYGSRAANGVIVIETKMPARGRLAVSYNFNATVEIPDLSDYNLMTSAEKLEFERLAGVYKDEKGDVNEQIRLDYLYQYRNKEVLKGVNTYWLSQPLQTSFRHAHSLSLGGGNEKSRYGINLSYGNNPGVMKGSKRDRLGLNFTWAYSISDKFRIGNILSVNQNKSSESSYGSFAKYATLNPYERIKDDEGRYVVTLSDGTPNPILDAKLNSFDHSTSISYNENFDFEWFIVEGIRFSGRIAYSYGTSEIERFTSPKSAIYANETDNTKKGAYSVNTGSNQSIDGNVVLNSWKNIGKHMLTLVLGANIQSKKNDTKTTEASGFLSDNMSYLDFALQYKNGGKPQGKREESRLIGFFGNASYSYNNRYLADISYRTDGSSKFGKKNRFAPYWSVGLGWNIHNEAFWKKSDWLTMAKIRGSMGYTGNVGFSPYQAQTMYIYTTDNMYTNGIGADIQVLGNPKLKWQRKLTLNIGGDFDFWNGRFTLSGEYFKERTRDLLVNMSIPPSLGFDEYKENLGEMENLGWSVRLRTQIVRNQEKDVYWSVSIGTSDSKNKIKKIGDKLDKENESNNEYHTSKPKPLYEEGESTDALKAVWSMGIDPESGKEIFRKKDGTLTTVWDYKDRVVCGSLDPDFQGSLSSFFRWNGVTLNLSMNFQYGGQSYNQTLAERVEGVDPHSNCDRRVLYDRWKKPGDKTFFKGISLRENISNWTSRFVQDYNYLALNSVSLGYELKTDKCRKIGLNMLRFNFNMGNVARISSIKEERGLYYPFARQFTFSLSASL